jgi:hypothetical protein
MVNKYEKGVEGDKGMEGIEKKEQRGRVKV